MIRIPIHTMPLRGQSNENMFFCVFADLDSKTSKIMKKKKISPSPYVKWCPRAPPKWPKNAPNFEKIIKALSF